ncbi:hypothetical protein GL307_15200 [Nocardia seriolae]|uniref:SRPBCC domain-containing protein n=1 Tax=Nocardia seriolae TaxID=37332 RepID=UPI001329474A|nr:SRPBCC domain-containing protein [Nocardia seriolae]MTL12884.1 hypothetical protein [Nocardia seriolae]
MPSTNVEKFVGAPRSNVFRALLDARSVRTWMVPDGMSSRVHEFDPRVGGRFRISLTYDEFETEDPDLCGEMTVTYTLADAPGGTTVTARHENLPPGLSPRDNEIGFRMSLAKLAELTEHAGKH